MYKVLQWLGEQQEGAGSVSMSQAPGAPDQWTLRLGGRLNVGLRFFLSE